jgi:hypothetical protein
MKSYLTNEHRAQIVAPGWDAQILDWHRDGATFIAHGITCALVRLGNGFMPYALGQPLSAKPEIPDTALSCIWRAVH